MGLSTVGIIVILAISILVAPFTADAQQATKVYRIGRLMAGSLPSGPDQAVEDFRQGLRDLGYVEGQNLVIEERYAEGRAEQLPSLAAELVRLKVDMIVAGGTAAIRAAQHASRTLPIVMADASLL